MPSAEDVYLNRAKFVMKILGVWLKDPVESTPRFCYRYFMVTLQYLFLTFQTVYIIQVWGDFEAMSQATYLLFTQACLCFKVTVFLVNQETLRKLLQMMASDTFKPQSVQQEMIIKSKAKQIKRHLFGFMVSSQVTCALWALKPLFDDAGREFPFRMWMPVSPQSSPSYELGYAFQLLTISMSAFLYFGVDSVSLSMVIFGCAQMDVIKDKLMMIRPVTEENRISLRKDLNKILDLNYKDFIQCVVHHQSVIKFTKMVEDAFHTYLLFQLSGSVGLICMSALRILVIDWQSMQFFSILTYALVMIAQMFICCWCGHELTDTSESLFRGLYLCPWYEQDIRFKKALSFAMLRMKRPLVFRAGHYVPLSRQTFVTILRTSYSYFAVLRQTNREKMESTTTPSSAGSIDLE